MTEQLRWEVIIDDKGAPKLVAMGNDAEKMGQKSEAAGRRLRRMGDDAEQAKKGIDKLSSTVGAVQVAMGNLASQAITNVASAMTNQIALSWEYGGALDDMHQRLGIATDDLQIMNEWAEQNGTDLSSLEKVLGKLTVKIADGDATLKRYNITSGDMNEAFLQVAAAVEAAPTQLEKARIANAAFGKSWQDMMPILKQGKEGLQEIAANVQLISQDDIEMLAKMDDRLAALKSTTRGLGAELLTAFGPATMALLEGMAVEVRNLHKAMSAEDDDEFITRIGAKKGAMPNSDVMDRMRFSYRLGGTPDQLSSEDIQRLLDYQKTRGGLTMGSMTGVQFEDPKAWTNLESAYKRALLREREMKKKADEESAKRREEDRRAQREMEAATELAEEQAKRDEAERKMLAQEEWMRRNAVHVELTPEMGFNRMIDQGVWNRQQEETFRANNPVEYSAKPTERLGPTLSAQMDEYGFRNGSSYTYATADGLNTLDTGTASANQMRAAVEAARAYQVELQRIAQEQDQVNAQVEEFGAAWDRVSSSISDTASGELAPALWDVFARGHDAMDTFGDAAGNILRNLTLEFTQLALKWAILSGISAGMGGAGPGSFLGFLGGGPRHATGTVSSPGGIGTLGEMGPERYRLPSGIEGIAMAGTYAIPKGTQVWPTQASSRQINFSPVFQIQGGDPMMTAAAIDRRIRDTAVALLDDQERTRRTNG